MIACVLVSVHEHKHGCVRDSVRGKNRMAHNSRDRNRKKRRQAEARRRAGAADDPLPSKREESLDRARPFTARVNEPVGAERHLG